jgi:3'(2'), 5'-bisphosphate nucleotidase
MPLRRCSGPGAQSKCVHHPPLFSYHLLTTSASQRPLSDPALTSKLLKLQPAALASLALLESRDAAHSSHDLSGKLSQRLGLTAPPVRMDSQAKYCALARGEGGILLRMPIPGSGYKEKIWVRLMFRFCSFGLLYHGGSTDTNPLFDQDHAPGALLVAEAGGKVSDGRGMPLDFGLGRTLGENFGVVAAHGSIHQKVIEAIAQEGEGKPSL